MRKLALFILFLASPAFAQVSPAPSSTGSINASGTTCATTNACVTLPMYATTGGVSVTVSGTFSATLQPEQSGDGVNWSSAGLSTISAAGTTTYTTIGMVGFRIRASAYVSGTAVVTITAGGAGGGGGVSASVAAGNTGVFYMSNNCPSGQTNCLQLVDDDATDNCGTPLTNFMALINGYSGPGMAQVNISGSGVGKAYLFKTCHLEFLLSSLNSQQGVIVTDNATIDAGTNSSANLIQFGDGTNSEQYQWHGGVFTGGASLTTAGIEVENQAGNAVISDVYWVNFGAGNATLGNCTNYAIQLDNYIYEATIARNQWTVSDATTGRCAFNNVGTTLGESTVMFLNNVIGGKSGSSCASQGIVDGGYYGITEQNNIGNMAVPIRLQGGGHRVHANQLDTEGCTASSVNAVIQYGAPSSSANIDGVTVTDNVAQFGGGHATSFFQQAGNSTATFSNAVFTGNTQSVTTAVAQLIGGTTAATNCGINTTSGTLCYEYANTNLNPAIPCGTTSYTGWQYGTELGDCYSLAQTANVAATTILTSTTPLAMVVGCQVVITTAATTSSTLPQCVITFTDNNSNVAQSITVTPVWASGTVGCSGSVTDTLGNSCQGSTGSIVVKNAVALAYSTTGYASVGATPMAYTVQAWANKQ